MRAFTIAFVALLSLLSAGPFSAAQDHQKVSRLPPLPQPLDPTLQEMFDKRRAMGGSVINLILTLGHAPKFAKATGDTAFTIRFDAVTPRSLIELAIFRTADIVGSNYELNQHTPMMKMCGEVRLLRPLDPQDGTPIVTALGQYRRRLGVDAAGRHGAVRHPVLDLLPPVLGTNRIGPLTQQSRLV